MNDKPADLRNLHDIVVPAEVSWWPLAPGWIALSLLTIVTASYYVYRFFKLWKQDAYRRAAIRQLAMAETPDQIAVILKRTALAIAPREEVAQLHGEAWIHGLSEHSKIKPTDAIRETLTRSIYSSGSPDPSDLREFAHAWISKHTRPC